MLLKFGVGRGQLDWVYIAKGMGIILVVVGHFYPKVSPAYWTGMRKIIYLFHMPLFFILSGYLHNPIKYSYSDLIQNKSKRLLYPFVSIAGSFFLIKYVAGRFVNLSYPVNIDSIYALLLDPVHSFMPLLWFIHALFLIFAIYPLARLLLNNISIIMLLMLLNSVCGSNYLVFGKAIAYMPFFVIGVVMRENDKLSNVILSLFWRNVFLLVMFILVYSMRFAINIESIFWYIIQLILGVVGSLVVINLSHGISASADEQIKNLLLQIGYYSMTIYLFHSLFGSIVEVGFFQVFNRVYMPFELIALVAITCGIVIPILLEKKVLRKFWVTKKFILGLS